MSELGELYASMTLKSLALSLVAIFIPVFLYQEGFSILDICLYFAFYFTLRIVFDILAGFLTARFGPKHMLAYSYVLLLIFLGMLLTLSAYGWPLYLMAAANALFNSFFFTAYHVDFSKIHSIDNAGDELSIMNILVRTAAAAGPFIGGLVATLFSIEVTITMALVLVLLAIWPLMLTPEPIKRNRKYNVNGFSIRKNLRNVVSYSALGISRQVALIIWPLYIAVFIFDDDVYAKVGLVTSVSIAATLLVTRLYGRIIDNKAGKALLNATSIFTAVTHLLRPAIKSLGGVTLVNITTEVAETGVILPFTKGFYDEADTVKDRISYIAMMESIMDACRASFWLVLVWLVMTFGEEQAMIASFSIAAAAALLVAVQRFKAL